MRKARRHFEAHEAEHYLTLAGDHLYRMDYTRLLDAHLERHADITIAALPSTPAEATAMGIFTFDRAGDIIGFEEKPNAERLDQMKTSVPQGSDLVVPDEPKPFIASMGIYLFSRHALLTMLDQPGNDFGRQLIPAALGKYRVSAYLFDGYWADVGTVASFYDANVMLTQPRQPFSFSHPTYPIYTHERFLSPSRLLARDLHHTLVADGTDLDEAEVSNSIVGLRTIVRKDAKIRNSVLLGADYYETESDGHRPGDNVPLGLGSNVELDRVIVDKNARIGNGVRLVNTRGVQEEDGQGYSIRNGIIIVPKDATIPHGFVL